MARSKTALTLQNPCSIGRESLTASSKLQHLHFAATRSTTQSKGAEQLEKLKRHAICSCLIFCLVLQKGECKLQKKAVLFARSRGLARRRASRLDANNSGTASKC